MSTTPDCNRTIVQIASTVWTNVPHLDEHEVTVAAGADEVWAGLVQSLDGTFSRRAAARYARAVGCADRAATGPRPLAQGSTFPGFHVVRAIPPSELALAGRHRFSRYELVFRVEQLGPRRSRLRAESRAAFPGVAGRAYRLLVVGTRGHVLGVRGLLTGIKRAAEADPRASVR